MLSTSSYCVDTHCFLRSWPKSNFQVKRYLWVSNWNIRRWRFIWISSIIFGNRLQLFQPLLLIALLKIDLSLIHLTALSYCRISMISIFMSKYHVCLHPNDIKITSFKISAYFRHDIDEKMYTFTNQKTMLWIYHKLINLTFSTLK